MFFNANNALIIAFIYLNKKFRKLARYYFSSVTLEYNSKQKINK